MVVVRVPVRVDPPIDEDVTTHPGSVVVSVVTSVLLRHPVRVKLSCQV